MKTIIAISYKNPDRFLFRDKVYACFPHKMSRGRELFEIIQNKKTPETTPCTHTVALKTSIDEIIIY